MEMKKQKVVYVGHSQGTSQMFAQLADNGYIIKQKISMFIACAPIVFMGHITNGPLKAVTPYWKEIYDTAVYKMHFYEYNDSAYHPLEELCNKFNDFCNQMQALISGDSKYHD